MKKISYHSIADLLSKVTGISIPIAGISWNPPKSELEIAKNLIIFLENKRVLYADYSREIPPMVSHSMVEIRNRLTEDLEKLDSSSKLGEHLREMRNACLEFQKNTDMLDGAESYRIAWDVKQRQYFLALGKAREKIGYYLSSIIVEYGIDVEENLASIFPTHLKPK